MDVVQAGVAKALFGAGLEGAGGRAAGAFGWVQALFAAVEAGYACGAA